MLTLWYLSLSSVFPFALMLILTESMEIGAAAVQKGCRGTV